MGARIVTLILCFGLAGCGGITPTATPSRQATPATAPQPPTLGPNPTMTTESRTPTPESSAPSAVPSKPASVTFDEQKRFGSDAVMTEVTQTISWGTPRSAEVEIKVYGVTECIARPKDPAPNTEGPCLVTGTPLPESVRTLLATAPASQGAVDWTWTGTFDCDDPDPAYDPEGPAYYAIVLAAYNSSGHSIFAIAAPGRWWEPGPNDVVC